MDSKLYTIAQAGEVLGEFDLDQLDYLWRDNQIGQETYYFHPCGQWKPLAPLMITRLQSQARTTAASMQAALRPVARTGANPAANANGYIHAQQPRAALPPVTLVKVQKSRGVYVILGLLFGGLGLHNFYAGRFARGAVELLVAIAGIAVGLHYHLFIGMGLWVLFELITIDTDGDGHKMA
jgi:TM2 domain-containing membrane protein YozV